MILFIRHKVLTSLSAAGDFEEWNLKYSAFHHSLNAEVVRNKENMGPRPGHAYYAQRLGQRWCVFQCSHNLQNVYI